MFLQYYFILKGNLCSHSPWWCFYHIKGGLSAVTNTQSYPVQQVINHCCSQTNYNICDKRVRNILEVLKCVKQQGMCPECDYINPLCYVVDACIHVVRSMLIFSLQIPYMWSKNEYLSFPLCVYVRSIADNLLFLLFLHFIW